MYNNLKYYYVNTIPEHRTGTINIIKSIITFENIMI